MNDDTIKKAARHFCESWPTAVYHPNDLTVFFEKGAEFGAALRDARIAVRLKRIHEIIETEQSLGGESALLRYCLETIADFEVLAKKGTP